MRELKIDKMIDYYRRQKNMTLKDLGKRLGKSESTVSKWVNGVTTPLAKDLSIMTHIFETDIETLMYGSRNDNPNKVIASFLNDLTEEEIDEVKAFIEFVKSKRK